MNNIFSIVFYCNQQKNVIIIIWLILKQCIILLTLKQRLIQLLDKIITVGNIYYLISNSTIPQRDL